MYRLGPSTVSVDGEGKAYGWDGLGLVNMPFVFYGFLCVFFFFRIPRMYPYCVYTRIALYERVS